MNFSSEHRYRRKGDNEEQTNKTKHQKIFNNEVSPWHEQQPDTGQAIAVFNAGGRLIDCNKVYAEIYRLPEQLTRPGTSFEMILEHQIEMGNYPWGDPNDYVATHLNLVKNPGEQTRIEHIPNWRSLRVSYISVNGGGWISILDDISEACSIKNRLELSSHYDRTTALPNKTKFLQHVTESFEASGNDYSSSVIAIDFSSMDGILGHFEKRVLMQEVSLRLTMTIRTNDLAARLEGSCFAVFLDDVKTEEEVEKFLHRATKALSAPCQTGSQSVLPNFFIGITMANQESASAEALLSQAIIAANQSGIAEKRHYKFYDNEPKQMTA